MKRFACHHFYASADGCYSQYVVELTDDGRLHTYFPLREEISHTQWLNGIIFLSPHTDVERREGESFDSFLQRVAISFPSTCEEETSLYGWYITRFDFDHREFMDEARVLRL